MKKFLLLLLLIPVLGWADCPTTPGSHGWGYSVGGGPVAPMKQEYQSNLHCEIHRCQRELEALHKEFPERKGDAYYEKIDVISPACVCKNLGGVMSSLEPDEYFGCNESKLIFKHNNGTSGIVQPTSLLKGWGEKYAEPQSIPIATQNINLLDDAKKDCEQIGFIPKTEKFGECVLKLHKKNQGQIANKAVTESNTNDIEKLKQQHQAKAQQQFQAIQKQNQLLTQQYQIQLATYNQQKKAYDAEQERQRTARNLKQIEMGLRMATGQSVTEAAMATAGMQPLPKPSQPQLRPIQDYKIRFQDGTTFTCKPGLGMNAVNCY